MQHKLSEGTGKNTSEVFRRTMAPYQVLLVQLFLSHAIVGAIVLLLTFVVAHIDISTWMILMGIIALGGGAGLVLTIPIIYHIYYVDRAVLDISQGRTARSPRFSWPLTHLFVQLQMLDQRVQTYIQGERAAAEIRRHYLQQASESATQTERQRIARDLHDSIKQQLFSINVSAATAKAYWSKDLSKVHTAVIDIQRVVKEAQVEMQALLQQLGPTPLENTPLAEALRTQAEALQYRSGLEMHVRIGDLPADELLPQGTQETIFRLVQEAFANIARHARATSVHVTLQQTERGLHLIVADNGQGFDSSTSHAGMGLTNMRERVVALNGTVEVHSAPGQGTNIHIVIPFLQLERANESTGWSEQEIKQGIERASGAFQLARVMQTIVLFFVVSNISNFFGQIPIVVIAICLCVGAYGFWQGYVWRKHLLYHRPKDDIDMLGLQQKQENLSLVALYLVFSIGVALWESQNGWGSSNPTLLATVRIVAVSALVPIVLWQGYRTQGRIYGAMDTDEIGVEIGYQRRKVNRHLRILAGIVLLVVGFALKFATGTMSEDTLQRGIIVLTSILLTGCLVVLLDFILLWQQKRSAKKK